jgi:hypothetical protein
MTNDEHATLGRWMRRALIAEHALHKAGLRDHTPADVYTDDGWLLITMTHKDGSPVHVDHLQAAQVRLAAVKAQG